MYFAEKIATEMEAIQIIRAAQRQGHPGGFGPAVKVYRILEVGCTWVVFSDGSGVQVLGGTVDWYPQVPVPAHS